MRKSVFAATRESPAMLHRSKAEPAGQPYMDGSIGPKRSSLNGTNRAIKNPRLRRILLAACYCFPPNLYKLLKSPDGVILYTVPHPVGQAARLSPPNCVIP